MPDTHDYADLLESFRAVVKERNALIEHNAYLRTRLQEMTDAELYARILLRNAEAIK